MVLNSRLSPAGTVRRRKTESSYLACPNPECRLHGRGKHGNIRLHSWLRTKNGRRRRYRCSACKRTFCATTGTAYYRLQHSQRVFEEVVALRMEGASIAAIARLKGLSWNTVARWLEKAGARAAHFNDERLRHFELIELQADELRTFALGKKTPTWVYTTMEVSSRLWPVMRVGRRGYLATRDVIQDLAARSLPGAVPLIATDGYRYYKPAIRNSFGGFCHFGQVIKTRRKDRIVKVERRYVSCTKSEMEAALERSEDSTTLNTSFIERLNLVIRQGSAYLTRRAATHARSVRKLAEHLELFRCFYNFIRPHSALRFGKEVRTPAQQAGLTSRKLTWRAIFTARLPLSFCARILRPVWSGSMTHCWTRMVA